MGTSAAIRMGTAGPPSLSAFLLRREFWKQLGMRGEDIEKLSAQEVDDYILFFQLIHREEEERARRASSGR